MRHKDTLYRSVNATQTMNPGRENKTAKWPKPPLNLWRPVQPVLDIGVGKPGYFKYYRYERVVFAAPVRVEILPDDFLFAGHLEGPAAAGFRDQDIVIGQLRRRAAKKE